jgi:hypothetical protein
MVWKDSETPDANFLVLELRTVRSGATLYCEKQSWVEVASK